MFNIIRLISMVFILFSISFMTSADAVAGFFGDNKEEMIGIEYLSPTESDRQIRTRNIEIHYPFDEVKSLNLSTYWGFIATYANGHIIQLEGSLAQGNLREVRYENSAFGLGPGLLASFLLWNNDKYAFHFNASGNFIIYNKRFPAGGDYYNFMWRVGPAFKFNLDKTRAIDIGYQWAHVSNGQGESAKNPSYEAKGVIIRFTNFF